MGPRQRDVAAGPLVEPEAVTSPVPKRQEADVRGLGIHFRAHLDSDYVALLVVPVEPPLEVLFLARLSERRMLSAVAFLEPARSLRLNHALPVRQRVQSPIFVGRERGGDEAPRRWSHEATLFTSERQGGQIRNPQAVKKRPAKTRR